MPNIQIVICAALLSFTVCGCSALENVLGLSLASGQHESVEHLNKRTDVENFKTVNVAFMALPQVVQKELLLGSGNKVTVLSGLSDTELLQLRELPIPVSGLMLGDVVTDLLIEENTLRFAVRLRQRQASSNGSDLPTIADAEFPDIAENYKYAIIRRIVGGRVNDFYFPVSMVANNIARFVQLAPRDIVRIEIMPLHGSPGSGEISVQGRVKKSGTVALSNASTLGHLQNSSNPDAGTIAVVSRVTDEDVHMHVIIPFGHPKAEPFATLQTQTLVRGKTRFQLLPKDSVAFLSPTEIPILETAAIEALQAFLE